MLEVFDANDSGDLSQRELKRRRDLFLEMDRDGNGTASEEEIRARIDLVGRSGVDVTASGFTERWDLDGDGKVTDDELPEAVNRVLRRRTTR